MRNRLFRNTARQSQAGLTLLEIMIVMAILGVLVAVVVPRLMGSKDAADINSAKIMVDKWKGNLEMWQLATKSEKSCGDVNLVGDVLKFSDKNLTADELKDPWGPQIQLLCEESGVKGVYSFGPNKKDDKGELDDIASWKKPKL